MLSPADEDLTRRDRSLRRALTLLLDEEAFAAALKARLPNVTIHSARAVYLRYKPQTNCLAAYRVSVEGQELDVYAKGYCSSDSVKLDYRKADRGSGGESKRGILLHNEPVVVFLFPYDRELRVLKHFINKKARKRLFRKLLPHHSHLWNGRIKTLRYKPERRFVAHLLSKSSAGGSVIKVYSPMEFRSGIAAATFRSRGVLRIPRVFGFHERHHMLAFEWIAGRPLGALLKKSASTSTIELVGAALAELHDQPIGGLQNRACLAIPPSLSEIAAGLEALAPLEYKRAAAFAQEIGLRLAESNTERRSVHGDFYDKQVLVTEQGIALLDLDQAAWNDPIHDLGTFLAHLEQDLLFDTFHAVRLEKIRTALLAGYERASHLHVPSKTLAIHTAAALVRLVHDPFRYRQSAWPSQIAAILDRVGQLLNHGSANKACRNASPAEIHACCRRVDPFGAAEDSTIPFLQQALDPVYALNKLRDCLFRYAGVKHIDLYEIRVTRHKRGQRCVIEYDVSFKFGEASEELVTLVGKIHAHKLDETGAQRLFALRRAGFDDKSRDGISVPEPLGIIPEFQMWLQRKVCGVGAGELLNDAGAVWLAKKIGRAIYKLQHAGIVPERQHTLNDELNTLRAGLSLVSTANPHWRRRLEKLMAACEQAATPLVYGKTLPAHRDFYQDQVVINGERLYLLDFDLFASAHHALDAGNFIAHLTEQGLRLKGNANALIDCENALEESLVVRSGGEISPASIRAFSSLTLVRHIYISTLFPNRRQVTESILELCERRLNVSCRTQASEFPALLPWEGISHVNPST